jgi:phosphopantetheinyl transferase
MQARFARSLSWLLKILRPETELEAVLIALFDHDVSGLLELAENILGPREVAYFSSIRFVRRQQSFLLGRYAAKLALRDLVEEPDLKAIEITRGVFEQPIVHCTGRHGWCVTISHTESLTVALAFPSGHPMGVDTERIDSARTDTILSQLSDQEIRWVEAAGTNRLEIPTALWTAKEALSKVLHTGLMSPVQIYNLSEFRPIASGAWEGLFHNFGQYKANSWTGPTHALSIVLPKRSALVANHEISGFL